jgi:DNA-binding transcriptional regulator YdaS (Cro superfamily)
VRDAQQRILADAAKLVGHDKLAEGLGVAEAKLAEWIEGRAAIPTEKFTQLSALLVKIASKKV